jgi:glucosylceramidase
LGHFARFIQPGARRLGCSAPPEGIDATAFANPDTSLAVVVANLRDQPWTFDLRVDGAAWRIDLPARAIATLSTP